MNLRKRIWNLNPRNVKNLNLEFNPCEIQIYSFEIWIQNPRPVWNLNPECLVPPLRGPNKVNKIHQGPSISMKMFMILSMNFHGNTSEKNVAFLPLHTKHWVPEISQKLVRMTKFWWVRIVNWTTLGSHFGGDQSDDRFHLTHHLDSPFLSGWLPPMTPNVLCVSFNCIKY